MKMVKGKPWKNSRQTSGIAILVSLVLISIICFASVLLFKSESVEISEQETYDPSSYVSGIEYAGDNVNIPCMIHRSKKKLSAISENGIDTFVESWQKFNPTCVHIIWDDFSMFEFVKAKRSDIVREYQWLATSVEKTDLFRYLIVNELGGVYADWDVECLKPINEWSFGVKDINAIVGMEWDRPYSPGNDYIVTQWTFASRMNHSIVRRAVEITLDNIRREMKGEHMWYSDAPPDNQIIKRTGPLAFTPAVQEYLDKYSITFREICDSQSPVVVGDVMILPVWSFSPGVGHSRSKPVTDPQACVRHYFEGSWKPK